MATLGERLRRARLERDVTEAQLAARLGIRQSALSMLESGEMEPGDDLASRAKAWISSGSGAGGPSNKAARGPYRKARRTIPNYQ